MPAASSLAGGLLLGLSALLLQGCGDCPVQEDHKLSRTDAVIEMLCKVAVAEQISKIETKKMAHLKEMCLGEIEVFSNLPKGKYTVEEHCEGWGSNHMLDAHAESEDFMIQNCSTWAKQKLGDNMTLVALFGKATECISDYGSENEEDFAISEGLYHEKILLAKNQTADLVKSLRDKANKAMNDALGDVGEEKKFEAISPLRQAGSHAWLAATTALLTSVGALAAVAVRARRTPAGAEPREASMALDCEPTEEAPCL